MPSSQSGSSTSGAENEDTHHAPAAEQGPGTNPSVGEQPSSDEELDTDSPIASGQDALDNHNFHDPSASPPPARREGGGAPILNGALIPPFVAREGYPLGAEEDHLRALFILDAQLKAVGKGVEQIDFIANFWAWITQSDFLHAQELEPIVGGPPPANYPPAVDTLGIRGRSVYTALFHHLDMEIFTCKICAHREEGELEDAITHQRVAHFRHYPYRCLPTHIQTQCGLRFANQAALDEHQLGTGH